MVGYKFYNIETKKKIIRKEDVVEDLIIYIIMEIERFRLCNN